MGADGADDSVIVGHEIGIAEIFAGWNLSGACRVSLGLRGFEYLHRLIVRDFCGVTIFQQFALPVFLGSAPRHFGICLRDLGFGDLEILAVLLRVEPG